MSPNVPNSAGPERPLRLYRGLAPRAVAPCVLTVGAFDGLHVGHAALIARALTRASERRLPAGLLSFEPMPREVLQPAEAPARLTNFRERWRLLETSGLERFHLLAFNAKLRALSGLQFMDVLRTLGVRALVVGHDFRFGHRGAANAEWCASEAHKFGFEVEIVAPVMCAGVRVSSGLVRAALAAGDMAQAARLLGRPYSMRARVARGARLGRTLGFPTANLPVHRRRIALSGIFAVRVRSEALSAAGGGMSGWPAVASLGMRPMVNGAEPLLEVHLFDYQGELYGAELEVEFVARLRDEQRFESIEAMVAQMHRDAEAARAALAPLV
jgi:riboflavin kinase / FMN adenylyltransferase